MKENPKHIQAQKSGKAPLEYLVYSVLEMDADVHKHGADKYGVRNWRLDEIRASTYEGAMLRHFLAWARGEDIDPDSGKPHLGHLRACCAVVLDADMQGTLIDDRNRMESKTPPALREEPVPTPLEGWPAQRCGLCRNQPCSCRPECTPSPKTYEQMVRQAERELFRRS